MYNPTTRLLTILELLQSRGDMSGQDLARILEVEERSVRRYIMMLRDMGIPIEGSRGRHGGYTLQRGFRLPPLMFNVDEISTVMMGLMLMRDIGSTSASAVESAIAKIERVLPHDLRQMTDALQNTLALNDVQPNAMPITTERLMTLSRAAHEGHCLTLRYASGNGDVTERVIAPYGLVLHGRTWYVPAHCFLRDDLRVFRVDRMREITVSDRQFTPQAGFDARRYVLESLARLPGLYRFEVVVAASLETVQAMVSPAVAVLEQRGDKTLMWGYADDPGWVARMLIRLNLPFTVCETDDLRAALRAVADEILRSLARDD